MRLCIGFTGTRDGMTGPQAEAVASFLREQLPDSFRHGDCYGADEQAARIADALEERPLIHCHPSTLHKTRAHAPADVFWPALPPLERNRVIVVSSRLLLAAPGGPHKLRSGTWSTVRFAREVGVPVYLAMPSGSIIPQAYEGNEPWTDCHL